ncbi:MAG: alpha-ketoglutarate-dependent dioxygenase AlkB [Thiolinea sp.]
MPDLLTGLEPQSWSEPVCEGAMVLRQFAAADAAVLLAAVDTVTAQAPFRHMQTPNGHKMSVGLTGCGACCWVSDRHGYRYVPTDPQTGDAWPGMPVVLRDLGVAAAQAAGFAGFQPDTCLINCYAPAAKWACIRIGMSV